MESINTPDGDSEMTSGSNPLAAQPNPSGQEGDSMQLPETTVWQGVIYYNEAVKGPFRPATCSITSCVTSSEQINADKWPHRLVLLLLQGIHFDISGIVQIFSQDAQCVNIHFSPESEASLNAKVKPGLMGFAIFPSTFGHRILFVYSQPHKHVYTGFVSYGRKTYIESIGNYLLDASDYQQPPQVPPLNQSAIADHQSTHLNQLKATRQRPQQVPRTSPYPKSKPYHPVSSSSGTPCAAGANTALFVSPSQELFEILNEAEKRLPTLQEVCNKIFMSIGIIPKPSDGSAGDEAIEELLSQLMNSCSFNK